MCYPKPGPRCSTHALKKLLDAKAELNSTDPTDIEKINEAKRKLTLAQEEYFTSPAGIKKLREKAKTTGDAKYAKMADDYAAKRKTQLAEYKRFVVDKNAVAQTKPAVNKELEKDIAAEQAERTLNRKLDADARKESEYKQAVFEHQKKREQLNNEFVALDRFQVPENISRIEINAGYDYDGQQCGPDGICSAYEGDYCRDSQYINLHVEPDSVRTSSTLANIYGCASVSIPEDLEKIGRDELDLDNAKSYDVEADYGYYGVEGATVTLANPTTVQRRLKQYYDDKYKELAQRQAELNKNTPKPVVTASKETVKSKPKNTKTASKTAVARSKVPSKRGASKPAAPVAKPKVQRRERTEAELEAFERDAMPLPSSRARKALLNDPVKKTSSRPRKEWTDAEMDAFEADQMN